MASLRYLVVILLVLPHAVFGFEAVMLTRSWANNDSDFAACQKRIADAVRQEPPILIDQAERNHLLGQEREAGVWREGYPEDAG